MVPVSLASPEMHRHLGIRALRDVGNDHSCACVRSELGRRECVKQNNMVEPAFASKETACSVWGACPPC